MATLELKAQSGQIRQATDDLRRLEQQGGRTESGVNMLARAFVVLGGAAVIGQAIRSTAQFSQAIADLSAITGAAGRDLQFYREQAAEIGRTTTLSASQAADAFKLIASAQPQLLGNAEALAQVTKEAVALAEATGSTLPEAAQALGASLNQFQLDATSASEVINILAASSQLGTAEVASVTEALRNAGSAANSLGLDLAETVAGIQALAASGRQGADAGTALRQVLLRLEQTGNRDLQPSIVGLSAALTNLAAQNLDNIELMELFGQEAFTAATSLLAQRGVVEELNVTLRGTSTAYEQAAIRVNTFNGDLLAFKSAIEALQIELFSDSVDGLGRSMLQAATGGVNVLNENLDTLTTAVSAIAAIMAGRYLASVTGATIASVRAAAASQAEAQAAFFAAQGYNAKALALSRVSVATGAATVASTALTGIMNLLGGPVGAIALTAFGIFKLTEGYRENVTAAEQRLEQMREELLLNPQLSTAQEEYNRTLENAFDISEQYRRSQAARFAEAAQGLSQDDAAAQYEKISVSLERAKTQLDRLNESGSVNQSRIQLLKDRIQQYQDQLLQLAGVYPQIVTGEKAVTAGAIDQESEFSRLTSTLLDQIVALQSNANEYERYQVVQRLGVDATKEEIDEALRLLDVRQRLSAQRQAEQEESQLSRGIGALSSQLDIETSENPELERLEQQLEARLSLIEEYRLIESENQAEADALRLAAEQSFQAQKSAIEVEAAQRTAEEIQKIEQGRMQAQNAMYSQMLGMAQNVFGSIASAIENAKGRESAAFKVAFLASKAAAIAQAILQTELAAVTAMAPPPFGLGPVAGLPYANVVRALGYASVGIMAGQAVAEVTGGRAVGGQVAQSSTYMVGERGPELFTPQTSGNITPFSQLMNEARNGQGGTEVLINVHNYESGETQVINRGFDPMQQKQIIDIVVGEARSGGRVQRAIISSTTANNRTS